MPESTRGRPRSIAARDAVLAAAWSLLAERGYPAMAIEAVAARAGVGKATVYRHWPGRAELALDAFFVHTQDQLVFPDEPDARAAFRAQLLALGDLLRGPTGAAFAAITAGARHDPALARAVFARWVLPRKRWGVARLERAIAERQASPTLDVDAALSALYSALYAPLLLGAGVDAPDRLAAALDLILAGIFASP